MSINIETAHLWLRHVARLWEAGRRDEAQLAGSRVRHVIEHLAEETRQALHPRLRRPIAEPPELL